MLTFWPIRGGVHHLGGARHSGTADEALDGREGGARWGGVALAFEKQEKEKYMTHDTQYLRWPSPFASMTPTVRNWAVAAFSHLTIAARRKAVEIAIASAFRMYARLLALGKSDLIYPEVLARYGVVQANGQMLITKMKQLPRVPRSRLLGA
jgi:hypothetical protein